MAKIFQLELFIKEMSIWKLPHNSEDCDETCVDVTVFDIKNVPINGYVFGKNSTMNRGQSFLFTLDAMPTDDNKVFFNVYKKAYNREKNFLGGGKIPIVKIFSDIFSKTFNDSNNTTGATTTEIERTVEVKSTAHVQLIADVQPIADLIPIADVKSTADPPVAAVQPISDLIPIADVKSTADPPVADVQPIGNVRSTTDLPIANADVLSAGVKHDAQQKDNLSEKKKSKDDITNSAPISRLTKDVYPINGADSNQWGTVCILMRLTSFGDFSAHPIHIHKNHNEIILQSTPNTAMYKCVPLDDLRRNALNANADTGFCKQHQPINYCMDVAPTNPKHNNSSDSDLCPCPPGSPYDKSDVDTQYEEFKAEINDNVLCVRMPKNAGIVRRVYDNNHPSKRVDYLQSDENAYSEHLKSIPVVRGNRKYPAHYGNVSSFPSSSRANNLTYDERSNTKDFGLQCNENRILQDDNLGCPSDVQIIRKNTDPNRDIFVLKIGQDAGQYNGIQLEMKTPKNPLANRPQFKHTTSVQTYDDEFVGQTKKGGPARGKKGGKKGGKK